MIETKEIKMAPKKMLSILFMQKGMPWLIVAILGVTVFLILGLILDPRFFVLMLIWIFLIFPLVIAFLYFYYGMNPLTAFNALPHKIRFYENHLEVEIVEVEKNDENSPSTTSGNQENPKNYTVNFTEFQELKSGSDYLLLFFRKNGWLWLPVYALDSMGQLSEIVDLLQSK